MDRIKDIGKGLGYTQQEIQDVFLYVLTMTDKERADFLRDEPDALEKVAILAINRVIEGNFNAFASFFGICFGKVVKAKIEPKNGVCGERAKD